MTVETGGKQILLHGLALILAGLVFGFALPLTPYPRLALGAHIQFVTNGMLFVVLAIVVLKVPHRAGPKSVGVMLASACSRGSWPCTRLPMHGGVRTRCSRSRQSMPEQLGQRLGRKPW
jgi:hypothetical protein